MTRGIMKSWARWDHGDPCSHPADPASCDHQVSACREEGRWEWAPVTKGAGWAPAGGQVQAWGAEGPRALVGLLGPSAWEEGGGTGSVWDPRVS